MAVYDAEGNQLLSVYDAQGNRLNRAYDAEGNVVYTGETIQLKVMEYNVGGWYIGSGTNVPTSKDASYYALQNSMIQNADADILCICEYWNQFSANRTAVSLLEQYYPYIHAEGGDTTYTGRCICSKYPITNYTVNVYSGDTAGRYYDKATINVDDIPIDVIVTHLHPSDQSEKIRTAKILFDYTETLTNRWIVCGDFNSTLYNPFSETNEAIYRQFLNAGDSLANAGTFGILPTACNSTDWANESFAIDQIIASPSITIDSVTTDLTKTTDAIADKIDHIPVIASLKIKEKIVFFGDSRTWYDGQNYTATTKDEWKGKKCRGYQQEVVDLLGIEAINQGINGATSVQICNAIRNFDFTGYDAVFLEGGVNDFIKSSQVTIGSIQPIGGTFDTSTVYGAWQSAVEYIQTNYPTVKIYVDIPAIAWVNDTVFPYSTAKIKGEIAELYNLPCLDLYQNGGITVENRDYYYADNVSSTGWRLHFNDYGNALIGTKVANFIQSNH